MPSEALPLPLPNMASGSSNREGSAPLPTRAFRLATNAVRSVMPRRRAESTGRLAPLAAGSNSTSKLAPLEKAFAPEPLISRELRPSCPWSAKSSAATVDKTPIEAAEPVLIGRDLRPSCPWSANSGSSAKPRKCTSSLELLITDKSEDGRGVGEFMNVPGCTRDSCQDPATGAEPAPAQSKSSGEKKGKRRSGSRRPANLPELDDAGPSTLTDAVDPCVAGDPNNFAADDADCDVAAKHRYRKTPRPTSKAPGLRIPAMLGGSRCSASPPTSQRSPRPCLEASSGDSVSVKAGTPLSDSAFADMDTCIHDGGAPMEPVSEHRSDDHAMSSSTNASKEQAATSNNEQDLISSEVAKDARETQALHRGPGALSEACSNDRVEDLSVVNTRSVVKQQLHNAFLDQRELGMSPTSAAIEALHRCAKRTQSQAASNCVGEAVEGTPDMPSFKDLPQIIAPAPPAVMTC